MDNERPRGVMVFPMPEEVTGQIDHYALAIRESDSSLRMVHTEGVAYAVRDNKPWVWNDYDKDCKPFLPWHLIVLAAKVEPVDLADWVRTFGARLESNFGLVYRWVKS